jgi:hypothetical protein
VIILEKIKYEIVQRIAILSGKGKWTKEINLISWNDRPPKYDLRDWNHDEGKMGKGITLTEEELSNFHKVFVALGWGK